MNKGNKKINFQMAFLLLPISFFLSLAVFFSSDTAFAADGCTQPYADCKVNGQDGKCRADDDDPSGNLFCQVGSPAPGRTETGTKACPAGFECRGGIAFPKETGLSNAPITTVLLNVLRWLLGIFGTIGVIAFVISGIQYLIAAGDEEMMEKGKNNMKYSIIGVIVGLVGLVIVTAIDKALNGTPFF